MEPLARPELEFVAHFTVDLGEPLEVGESGFGRRRVIPIVGGRFEGPRFRGRVLDLGADWQAVAAEGTARIDTRYMLETDDGALVSIATRGYRHGPADVLAALAAGEAVDPARYYFRIAAEFDTSADAYRWLTRSLIVATGARLARQVVYDAYRLS